MHTTTPSPVGVLAYAGTEMQLPRLNRPYRRVSFTTLFREEPSRLMYA